MVSHPAEGSFTVRPCGPTPKPGIYRCELKRCPHKNESSWKPYSQLSQTGMEQGALRHRLPQRTNCGVLTTGPGRPAGKGAEW